MADEIATSQAEDQDPEPPLVDPVILGVPLSAYAAVIAHRGEGILLADSLEHQAIDPAIWIDVDRAWSARIADDACDLDGERSLITSFDRYRAEAEAHVERPLHPLDEDLRAWLNLFRLFCASDRASELLAEHGLAEGDVFRLLRHWDRQIADDRDRLEEMGRILAEPAGPVPAITTGPPRLIPETRRTPGAGAEPDALGDEDIDVVPSERVETVDLGLVAPAPALPLADYARLRAELTRAPKRTDEVLERWRLTRESADALHEQWWARFGASPAERDAFDVAYQRALEDLQRAAAPPAPPSRPAQPPRPPPRPRNKLGDTITAMGAIPGDVLPFAPSKPAPQKVEDPLTATLPPSTEHDPVLPFAAPPLDQTRAPTSRDMPVLPFTPRASRPAGPKLPLRGYALMCAEIGANPAGAMAIIARYGLSVDDKRAEDAAWQARFDADPRARMEWRELVQRAAEKLGRSR